MGAHLGAEGAGRARAHPRPQRARGPDDPRVHTAGCRDRHREGPPLGRRQRRGESRPRRRRARGRGGVRGRGADAQALEATRARPGQPDPQAHMPRHARPRRGPGAKHAEASAQEGGNPGSRGDEAEGLAEASQEGGGCLMGQKVHPGGFRVGVIHDWKSNWWTGTPEFADYLLEDVRIREHILGKLSHAGLSDILIRKDKQRITVDIYTARPGIVIRKSGVEVDALRKELHTITKKNVHININEIKRPELDAKLVAQSIAEQLQNRVSFRRAMKRSLASAMRSGAQGIKITAGGRLGGGEMSRREMSPEGRVPLHTIRADIDYGQAEAKTTFGVIGVKVWVNKGEIMPEGYDAPGARDARLGDQDQARRRRGASAEGLGASRESGRRGQDREGLGIVPRKRR